MHLLTRKYNSIKNIEASLPKSFRDFAHVFVKSKPLGASCTIDLTLSLHIFLQRLMQEKPSTKKYGKQTSDAVW